MLSRAESRMSHTTPSFDQNERSTISVPPPASAKGHQRSRTTVDLPPLFSRTPSASPTRLSTFVPFSKKSRDTSPNPWASAGSDESYSPSSETQRRVRPGTVGKFTSWFEGASEPVNIVLVPSPKKEKPEPFYQLYTEEDVTNESNTSMDNLTRRPTKRHLTGQSTANSSRFSFFKKTTTTHVKTDPDELIQMDVREALMPEGPVDEMTPATFKGLQQSAESLLRRFQMSYAENIGALRQITSEKNVQADELDAARTRSDHLKMQLLEMAEKASDQEKVITSLRSQLAQPQSSVRIIIDDEQFMPRRHNRRNRVSDSSASDESFVDSDVSSAVSIFSDIESIRTPSTSTAPSPMMKHASLYSPTLIQGQSVQAQVTPILVPQCQNCHNVPASEAWDVVEMMKMESACLKQRIADLESAQDSALDFLATLKL